MRRFRPAPLSIGPVTDLGRVMDIVDAVWLPGHFFVAPSLKLVWEFSPRQETPWQLFHGNLLQREECDESRVMAAWDIHELNDGTRSAEPILAIKLDPAERVLHIVRGLVVYSAGKSADLASAETTRWRRELVGALRLSDFADLDEVRDELICLLWQAVVGTSRLPLNSLQAPLPVLSFGLLHYCFRVDLPTDRQSPQALSPLRDWRQWPEVIQCQALSINEYAKGLEFFLRSVPAPDVEEAAERWLAERPEPGGVSPRRSLPGTLRRVFNDISLSPYTDFVTKFLRFLDSAVRRAALTQEEEIDLLAHLLRQNYRHLLAYDLVLFHHRGANYPDALLLEETLPRYAALLGGTPRKEPSRLMALVQGSLLIERYQRHAVPDAPTSPGENVRILPGQERVPEEQLDRPDRRRRRLFADWSWNERLGAALPLLRSAVSLLADDQAFLELGKAIFIDRPFGLGKHAVEPDHTLLLAQKCFSLTLANAALGDWRRLLEGQGGALSEEERRLLRSRPPEEVPVRGVPISEAVSLPRPVPSLADAQRVAPDFLVLRTLPGSVQAFRQAFANSPEANAEWWDRPLVISRFHTEHETALVVFDAEQRVRLIAEVDVSEGYRSRAGLETPRAGLTIIQA